MSISYTAENTGGAPTTYTWDYENRLVGVSSPNGVETYAYSANGMREEKENSSRIVYYVRDGENVLIETDTNLVTQAHYTDFPGVWGGLASERRGSTSSFYGFDQQANTRLLVSPAGAVTDDYLYKAFGEEVAVLGATVNSLRFGGQVGYWRDEAERVYVRARHLRTDMGRWMSRDPIGFDGGDWNLYRYVTGNPVIKVDPSGLTYMVPGTGGTWISDPTDSNEPRLSKHDKKCELLKEIVQKMLKNYAKKCLDIKNIPHYDQFETAEMIKELVEYAEYIKKLVPRCFVWVYVDKVSYLQTHFTIGKTSK